jgi:hypothetical protein
MGRKRVRLKKAKRKFWTWFFIIKALLLAIILALLWYAFHLFKQKLI